MRMAIVSLLMIGHLAAMARNGLPEIMVYRSWGSTLFHKGLLPEYRSTRAPNFELLETTTDREVPAGTNGLDIHLRAGQRLELGMGFGFLEQQTEMRIPAGRRPDHDLARIMVGERSLLVVASTRYRWNTGRVILYSGAQAGIRHYERWSDREEHMETVRQVMPVYQVTPLGLRAGGRLAGHLELGYGHKGILALGLSWSFDRER
jgi:hypothetical protein